MHRSVSLQGQTAAPGEAKSPLPAWHSLQPRARTLLCDSDLSGLLPRPCPPAHRSPAGWDLQSTLENGRRESLQSHRGVGEPGFEPGARWCEVRDLTAHRARGIQSSHPPIRPSPGVVEVSPAHTDHEPRAGPRQSSSGVWERGGGNPPARAAEPRVGVWMRVNEGLQRRPASCARGTGRPVPCPVSAEPEDTSTWRRLGPGIRVPAVGGAQGDAVKGEPASQTRGPLNFPCCCGFPRKDSGSKCAPRKPCLAPCLAGARLLQ